MSDYTFFNLLSLFLFFIFPAAVFFTLGYSFGKGRRR